MKISVPKYIKEIIPGSPFKAALLCFCCTMLTGMSIIYIISPITGLSRHFGKSHDGYIQLAENIAEGHGYVFKKNGPPVFHRPPFYPLLLVPVTYLPETVQRPAIIILHSIMTGLTGLLMFITAKKIFTKSAAGISVIIFLVYPWLYWHAKNPMTPILQGLLYMLLTVLVGNEFISEKASGNVWIKAIATGAAMAALSLTHGTMLAVCISILLVLLLSGASFRNPRQIKFSLLVFIAMLLFISPWTYRNYKVFNKFMPVTGGAGLAYFNGNTHFSCTSEKPRQQGEYFLDASLRAAGIQGRAETHTHWMGPKNMQLEEKLNQKMKEDITKHPFNFIQKIALNAVEYYFPFLVYPFLAVKTFSCQELTITVFHLLLWALALKGLWNDYSIRKYRQHTLLLFFALIIYAAWYFPFATFIGHSLYSFGTIPLLAVLAGVGLAPKSN